MNNKNTVIYINGEDYLGTYETNNLNYWKQTGYIRDFKYMYKGFRYHNNEKDIIIVYTNEDWNKGEKARRKTNGFLGIKQYICHA